MLQGPKPCFPCSYGLNKPKPMKKYIGGASCGESPVSSTPLDILRMGVARWTFVLVCVWLGHRVITNHVWAQAVTRAYPVPPKRRVPP